MRSFGVILVLSSISSIAFLLLFESYLNQCFNRGVHDIDLETDTKKNRFE